MESINGIIYKAENKVNGKVYIGKTIQKLYVRKKRHKFDSFNIIPSGYFHRAIRKHGWDNFEWSILCETDSESKLKTLEKFYIAAYRKMGVCYNMTDGGEGLSGWYHSEETRKKISLKNKGKTISKETREKLSEINKGKKLTETTILKLKGRPAWNKGKALSDDHKRKLSENHADFKGEKSVLFGKKLSAELRQKISEKQKGRFCGEKNYFYGKKFYKENNSFYGKTHSEESRRKMSEAAKKRKRQPMSEETKLKISEANKKRFLLKGISK